MSWADLTTATPAVGILSDMAVTSRHGVEETQSRQPYQIASSTLFLMLSIIAVGLRLWVRTYAMNSFGWDDVMMVIALIMYAMYNAALMVIVANGGGTHIVNARELNTALTWTIINEDFYLLTTIFLKLSLGIFFLRVVTRKWQRRVIIGTMVISTVVNAYHFFFVIFQCGNPRYYAERIVRHECVSKKAGVAMAYEQAAISTSTDFVFALMPIPILWNARMDIRSKISVGVILSLGTFGSISSVIRFLYMDAIAYQNDFFWAAVNLSIWSTIELGVGIVAGSLATLRPLLKRWISGARRHMTHPSDQQNFVFKSSQQCGSTQQTSTSPEYSPSRKLHRDWTGSRSKDHKNADTTLNSLQSVFTPWELASLGKAGGITTTTVLGGANASALTEESSPSKESKVEYGFGNSRDCFSWPAPIPALSNGLEGLADRDAGISKHHVSGGILNVDAEERAAIWPFVDDDPEVIVPGGISKVVDVEVCVEPHPEKAFYQRNIADRQASAARMGRQYSERRISSSGRGWFGLGIGSKSGSSSAPSTVLSSRSGGGLWGERYEDKIQSPTEARTRDGNPDKRPVTPEWERLPDLFPLRRGSDGSRRPSRSDRNSVSEGKYYGLDG